MAQQLSWALYDLKGNRLAQLRERLPGAEVAIGLNGQRTAKVAVSFEDEAARHARPFETVLRAWLDEALIFAGPLVLPRATSELRGVDIAAIGAGFRMEHAYCHNFPRQEQIDQGEIMWQLILHADRNTGGDVPSHGIVRGSIPTSVIRDRSYRDGKQIWEALVDMSNVIGGPDFELLPQDRGDGTLAQLDVHHPRQGTDRTEDVRLEYNLGRHTATHFDWEPGGGEIVNYFLFAGQALEGEPAPAWIAEQKESQERFGIYERFSADPDIKRTETLRQHSEQAVAALAFPIDFFDVTPVTVGEAEEGYVEPPPVGPNGAYWIGDTIRVLARDTPGLDLDLRGRVTDLTLFEQTSGAVGVRLTCAPLIVATAVTGRATTVSGLDLA